jgi:hypothetical protein
LCSEKSTGIFTDFPADFVIKMTFPADLEFSGKSAGTPKDFPANFG